jgi:hypothetical protein
MLTKQFMIDELKTASLAELHDFPDTMSLDNWHR